MKLDSLEAEQSVLGAVMVYNDLLDKVKEALCVDDFVYEQNKIIFECICDIEGGVNSFTVSDAVDLESIGGREYLVALDEAAIDESRIDGYIESILKHTVKRELIRVNQFVAENINKQDADVLMNKMSESIEKINAEKKNRLDPWY